MHATARLSITNSTITRDTVYRGAGIYMFSGACGFAQVTLRNSTVARNLSRRAGGGVRQGADEDYLILTSSTS